jgi:hypothetical protein
MKECKETELNEMNEMEANARKVPPGLGEPMGNVQKEAHEKEFELLEMSDRQQEEDRATKPEMKIRRDKPHYAE